MPIIFPIIVLTLLVVAPCQAKTAASSLAHKNVKMFDIKFTSSFGVDSNPYRFSNQYSTDSREYLQQELRAKILLSKHWYSKFSLKDVQYQHASDWADSQKISAELAYNKGKKRQKSLFNLKYEQLDKTYVSRLSGGLSSYSDTQLNDRYDYQQLSTYWSQQHKVTRSLDWRYKLAYRVKDYDDFSTINISNLDYQSVTLTNDFSHKITKRLHHIASLKISHRDYQDKRQKDIKGEDLTNTELSYLDSTLGYEHLWQQTKRHKLSASWDYMLRKDNGSGYYDSRESTLKITSKYRLNAKTAFTAQYQYVDFSYERPSVQSTDTTTEEYSSHQQHRIKLNSRINLRRYLPLNAQWLMAYEFVNEDSDKSQYTYKRHILETGLRFTF